MPMCHSIALSVLLCLLGRLKSGPESCAMRHVLEPAFLMTKVILLTDSVWANYWIESSLCNNKKELHGCVV